MTENKRFILKENGLIDDTQLNILLDGGEDKEDMVDLLNDLNNENEQLKQRNDRQAKQLDRLYNLIEQKDWRALNDILDDFKQCEEQLQREWKCYE